MGLLIRTCLGGIADSDWSWLTGLGGTADSDWSYLTGRGGTKRTRPTGETFIKKKRAKTCTSLVMWEASPIAVWCTY